jgi:hypothetical protein
VVPDDGKSGTRAGGLDLGRDKPDLCQDGARSVVGETTNGLTEIDLEDRRGTTGSAHRQSAERCSVESGSLCHKPSRERWR